MKDAYTCEHPVRMTEADGVCGWRVRMTCAYTCEHRLTQTKLPSWKSEDTDQPQNLGLTSIVNQYEYTVSLTKLI